MFGGFFSGLFKAVGSLNTGGSQGCFMTFLDEPEMPKCMIEK